MKILACIGLLCVGVVAGIAATFIAEKNNGGPFIDFDDDADDIDFDFDDEEDEDGGEGLTGDSLEV